MNSKESVIEGRRNRQTELNSYDPSNKLGFKNRLVNRNTTPCLEEDKGWSKIQIIFELFYLNNNYFHLDSVYCKFIPLVQMQPFVSALYRKLSITLTVPCISESCIEIKIKLNCYFHTSLWCLKRYYEDLYGLHKTF